MRNIVTVKEYAKHINSSVSAVRKLIDKGVIPAYKIGLGYKIDVDGADDVIYSMMVEEASRIKETNKAFNFLGKLKTLT